MNKLNTTLLAILGGINATLTMFTPIILAVLWIRVAGLEIWTSYFFFTIGLLATLFRAIQIGFLKG
jgi:hypothetical protein